MTDPTFVYLESDFISELNPLPSVNYEDGEFVLFELSDTDKQIINLRETRGKEKVFSNLIPTGLSSVAALAANLDALLNIIPDGDVFEINDGKESIEEFLRLRRKGRIVSLISDKVKLIFSTVVDINRYWSLLQHIGLETNLIFPLPIDVEEIHENFITALQFISSSVYIFKPLMVVSDHFFIITKGSNNINRSILISSLREINDGINNIRENMIKAEENLKRGHESFYLARPHIENASSLFDLLNNKVDTELFNEIQSRLKFLLTTKIKVPNDNNPKSVNIETIGETVRNLINLLYLYPKFIFNKEIDSIIPSLEFEDPPSTLSNVWKLWFLWRIPQYTEERKREKRGGCSIINREQEKRRPFLIEKTDQSLLFLGRRIKYQNSPRYTESYIISRHAVLNKLNDILGNRLVPWLLDQRLFDVTPIDDIIPSRFVEGIGPETDDEEKRLITRLLNDFRQEEATDYTVKIKNEGKNIIISIPGLPSYTVPTDMMNRLRENYKGKQFNRDVYSLFDRYAVYKNHLSIPSSALIDVLGKYYGNVIETFSSPLWRTTNTYYSLFSDNEFQSQGHFFEDRKKSKEEDNSTYLSMVPSNSEVYLSGLRARLDGKRETHFVIFSGSDVLNMGQFANLHLILGKGEHTVTEFENSVIHVMVFSHFVPDTLRQDLMDILLVPSLRNALTEDESQALLLDLDALRHAKRSNIPHSLANIDPNKLSSEDRLHIFLQFLRFTEEVEEIVSNYWFDKIGYKPETLAFEDIETFYRSYFNYLQRAPIPEIQNLLDAIQE